MEQAQTIQAQSVTNTPVKRWMVTHEHKHGQDRYYIESSLPLNEMFSDVSSLDTEDEQKLDELCTKCGIDFDQYMGEFLNFEEYEEPGTWVLIE